MDKRPEGIDFIKANLSQMHKTRVVLTEKVGCPNVLMTDEEISKFSEWVNTFEEYAHSGPSVKRVISFCKAHYGDKFNKLFDEEALKKLNDNWMEIALWEMEQNIACD